LDAFRIMPEALEMDFWVTPNGSARPGEILALLGLGELLAEGAVIERRQLELHDEISQTETQQPHNVMSDQVQRVTGPGHLTTSEPCMVAVGPAGPNQTQPTPLIPGPLDY